MRLILPWQLIGIYGGAFAKYSHERRELHNLNDMIVEIDGDVVLTSARTWLYIFVTFQSSIIDIWWWSWSSLLSFTQCIATSGHTPLSSLLRWWGLRRSKAHQVDGSREGGPLSAVRHSRSWLTAYRQYTPTFSSLSLHGQSQCAHGSANASRATVGQTLLVGIN